MTSNGGKEVGWDLDSCSNRQGYENHQEYHEECCLEYGEHTLSCHDSNQDGWEGGYIEVSGVKYCNVLKQFKTRKEQLVIGNSQ